MLVTGTFNLLHCGHIQLLEFAARFGKVTVGVNADPFLQQKYGDYAIPLVNRVQVLRACRYIDDVVVFSEEEPSKLIRRLRPRYYVRGPDYQGVDLVEAAACYEVGAKILIQSTNKIYNSSELIHQLPASVFSVMDILDL